MALAAFSIFASSFAPRVTFSDCSDADSAPGPFGPPVRFNASWEGKPIFGLVPTAPAPAAGWPLVVFMHGSTGQWEMYSPNIEHYTTHGFVLLFPFVKSPEADKNPLTTNTDGTYILHGIEYARNASGDAASPLYGKVDMTRVVSAGHSMGATCSIMAGKRLAESGGALRLVVTQHPGICGPFGPPPWPATWLESELRTVADHYPLLFTTATNDGAFWPAPHTAEHELGCFNGSKLDGTNASAFVQFSAAACAEDGARAPFKDGGHNCPFKDGATAPETPWVLTAIKLYAQQDGRQDSACAARLWGDGAGSLAKDDKVEKLVRFHKPALA